MIEDNFDYDTFFGDSRSPETSSSQTNCSPKSETDADSGISSTTQLNMNFDDTVLDLNHFDLMPLTENDAVLNDPNLDFEKFSSFLNENNFQKIMDSSTFDTLFADFPSPEQTIQALSPPPPSSVAPLSPPLPTAITTATATATTTSTVPTIINCVKFPSIPQLVTTVPPSLKIESVNKNPVIRIIKTTKPLPSNSSPVIHLATVKTEEPAIELGSMGGSPTTKRRRSESPVDQISTPKTSTLTMEQLRAQYGNMNDEALKKHLRMIKNRESAAHSRKRRKDLMESLDTQVKSLTTENEQLKKENSRLHDQIRTLKIENELLKKYKPIPNNLSFQTHKPIVLFGVTLFLVFNFFVFSTLNPLTQKSSGEIEHLVGERAMVPSRTILSQKQTKNQFIYSSPKDPDDESTDPIESPNLNLNYPYIQCVAYINKTHSKRINQDLRSLVEEYVPADRELIIETHPMTLPSNTIETERNDVIPSQPPSRRISLRDQHLSKENLADKNQLEPYKKFETFQDDFIQSIDRKNDTVYFVSFKRDHLIFPATAQNQTQRPKMSIILPASIANLNKSIHIPSNHIPMIKIDCDVEDTQLVFVKQNHIPLSYRHDLLQYYSSANQAPL